MLTSATRIYQKTRLNLKNFLTKNEDNICNLEKEYISIYFDVIF